MTDRIFDIPAVPAWPANLPAAASNNGRRGLYPAAPVFPDNPQRKTAAGPVRRGGGEMSLRPVDPVGDALVERVAHEETHRDQINQEKSRVIRPFVTGRPCLAGAAVRLLNLPDGIQPGAVSEAARQSLPADGGAATDLDIVEWIGLCKRSYNTCRGRLQAIHDFFGGSAVSDDVDRAQAREQEMRQDALAEHAREAQIAAAVDSAEFCAMCGEAIPEGRRDAVPGVQTCIDCQKDVERLGMRVR